MSRVGKQPILIPKAVSVAFAEGRLVVRGPKGALATHLPPHVNLNQTPESVGFECIDPDDRRSRQQHGLTRALVSNMIQGVSEGFDRHLELQGVGYRAALNKDILSLSIGLSSPVDVMAPPGIKVSLLNTTNVLIQGIDKQQVGWFAAKVRALRPPDSYKGKGIRYGDEIVKLKSSKGKGKK